MRAFRCLLLGAALAVSACGADSDDPAADATSTTTADTTVAADETTTTTVAQSPPGSGDGLGESVGVRDEVVITVRDAE